MRAHTHTQALCTGPCVYMDIDTSPACRYVHARPARAVPPLQTDSHRLVTVDTSPAPHRNAASDAYNMTLTGLTNTDEDTDTLV